MYHFILSASIDLRDPIWQFWISAGSLILSALAIIVTIVLTVRSRQRKLLTYEVRTNASVINVKNDVGENIEILVENRPVTTVRMFVIRLMNAGNVPIEAEDYTQPIRLQFKDPFSPNPLVSCAISGTEPESLIPPDQLKSIVTLDMQNQTFISLKTPLLNPRDAIILRVLLMARDKHSTQLDVFGQVRDGRIKESQPVQPRIARGVIVGGVLIAFTLGLLLSNSIGLIASFTRGTCALGSIQVSGSTSFYNTATSEAQKYRSVCPISSISINESSSGSGLTDLENGTLQIANSEIPAPASANLLDHQVAVIVFALIINKNVNIANLSKEQIKGIYNGTFTSWQQVDKEAPNLPIKVIGRSSSSGTHRAFVKYVLGDEDLNESALPPGGTTVDRSSDVVSAVANTPGAIGYADLGDASNTQVTTLEIDQHAPIPGLVEAGIYQFWAIEHMYTKSNPDALSTSFIDYTLNDMQSDTTFIRITKINSSALASHAA